MWILTPAPLAKPRPPATLVYSREEVAAGPPTPGLRLDEYGGYPSQPLLNRHWMVWSGSRLSQITNAKGEHLRQDGIFAYDFMTQQRSFLGEADSLPKLNNDTLYFGRNDLSYAYNLQTGVQKHLVTNNVEPGISNSTHRFWIEGYPAICKQALTCQEEYQYACQAELFSSDLKTKTRQSLGILSRDTLISQATETQLLLRHYSGISSCNIKASPLSYSVLDLTSGQVWAINDTTWNSEMRFINLNDNIMIYSFIDGPSTHTRVVHIAPGQPPTTLFYSERMLVQGTAGLNILLYTPIPENRYWPQAGLIALNLKTGWMQTLDQVNAIYNATGDDQHFAWTTYGGELYVVPANLKPAPDSPPISAPASPLIEWTPWRLKPAQ
ncbi:MAG: hypothetical protein NT075_36200 [Chloroflexi bacterium]|nr:hypothetical protein [Chloroflexota bacterium]